MKKPTSSFLTVSVLALTLAACGSSTDAATSPTPLGPLTIVALTPTTLAGTAGTRVDSAPTVRVTDISGRPRAGVAVTFEVTAGQGSLIGASTRTESDGTAHPGSWILGTVAAKPNVVRARLSGDGGPWVEFTATARAGAIAAMIGIKGNAQVGFLVSPLADPLSVKVMDAFGNAIAGAHVTFSPAADNGRIEAPDAIANDSGIATSGTWTLGVTFSSQRAKATAGTVEFLFTAFAIPRCTGDCPTSQRLVYVRNGDIYAMNTNGTELVQLTATGTNSEPTWSPDGRRIAFVRGTTAGSDYPSDVHIMDANGDNVRLFAPYAQSPAWSPDGKKLAYSALASGEFKIFIAPVDAAGPVIQVGFDRGYNAWPTWSPDGSKLAFVSDYGAFDFAYDVYVMNADGSNITQVTNGFFGNVGTWPSYTMFAQPVWSPDGRHIALVSCPAWQYYNCNTSAIAIMSPDGLEIRELVTAGGFARPSWSPDGQYLAYTHGCANGTCSPSVYFIPVAGGNERLLIPGVQSAQWRP